MTRFDSLISSDRTEGSGVLADISCTGALVEESTLKPELGKTIRLYVFVQPIAPFEVVGTVVRHTGSGFATPGVASRSGTRTCPTKSGGW